MTKNPGKLWRRIGRVINTSSKKELDVVYLQTNIAGHSQYLDIF